MACGGLEPYLVDLDYRPNAGALTGDGESQLTGWARIRARLGADGRDAGLTPREGGCTVCSSPGSSATPAGRRL